MASGPPAQNGLHGRGASLAWRLARREHRATSKTWAWLAVVIGIVLRVAGLLDNRPLYRDERSLLINLVELPVLDFHTTLTEYQLAPPGFMVIERLLVRLPGSPARHGRWLPLVCGVAAMLLFPWTARRFISARAVPIATALFALSGWLIYYSSEIKQYSCDLLLTLIALGLAAGPARSEAEVKAAPAADAPNGERWRPFALAVLERLWLAWRKLQGRSQYTPLCPPFVRGEHQDRAAGSLSPLTKGGHRGVLREGRFRACAMQPLGALGTFGVWFSYPLALVLGAIGTHAIVRALRCRDLRRALVIAATCAVWALSCAGCYVVSHRVLSKERFIWDWWDFAFLRLPPHSLADLKGVGWQLLNVFNSPADVLTPLGVVPSAFLALGLFLVGCAAMAWRRPGALGLLCGPIGFAIVASALRQYPFHGRLLIFLVPAVHMLVGQGAATLARPGGPWLAGALGLFLIVQPALDLAEERWIGGPSLHESFDSHGDLRHDLLDYLEEHKREQDREPSSRRHRAGQGERQRVQPAAGSVSGTGRAKDR